MEYLGNKAGTGISLGKVLIINNELPEIADTKNSEEVFNEKKKVDEVFEKTLNEFETLVNNPDKVIKDLIEFYKMILLSKDIKTKILELIENDFYNAAYAINRVLDEKEKQLSNIENEYLKERSKDIYFIKEKLIKNLFNIKDINLNNINSDVILVSKNLDTGILLGVRTKHIKGIISEVGSKTSHLAIIANSLGIPSVFGIKNVDEILKNDELIYLDGNKGLIKTNLSRNFIKKIQEKIKKESVIKDSLNQMINEKAITRDNVKFEVVANTGDLNELEKLMTINSDGIGLFRTEFLFLNKNKEPSEDELFKVYKLFAEKMGKRPCIIRTLDIGGDKIAAYINIDKEDNPSLGYRAIRYCLGNKTFFKKSLRAILRASYYGNVMIMYPMISSIEEIIEANLILDEAKKELDLLKIKYNQDIKIGIMVEIPSIALIAEQVIQKVDFFSIGTNDLVQYTIAVDRLNSKVSYLYDWFHPGVIKLIKMTIDATKPYKDKFVGMCGEMAADPLGIILLVGLGLNEFSVNIDSVLKVKKMITLLNYQETKKVVNEILKMSNINDIKNRLDGYAKKEYQGYY